VCCGAMPAYASNCSRNERCVYFHFRSLCMGNLTDVVFLFTGAAPTPFASPSPIRSRRSSPDSSCSPSSGTSR
jgi:hypothetical protein